MSPEPLLAVEDLVVEFPAPDGGGAVRVVDEISLTLAPGEALGVVGESGSGKSMTAFALMGLLPAQSRTAGSIRYRGEELLADDGARIAAIRGREVAMVYQDPMTSLNPVLSVGHQLTQVIRHHRGLGKAAARERAVELLRAVGIPGAAARLRDHPHQFSGGQRQRIVIALALSCDPKVLVADEPTTALDVTVQAEILALVARLREQSRMATVWITHDLGVVGGFADRVAVMYSGRVVEQATVAELFRAPSHPYTIGLLNSLPRAGDRTRLTPIPGSPPDPAQRGDGCAFAPRCAWAVDACRVHRPQLEPVGGGHEVACHRWREVRGGIEHEAVTHHG
ncbi:ABC transporter ATP-binding protein [Conexibacter arvalis]|uniref:Oligopeptide/dipeptide ABC transporter ATP-binding protein n=1 Tax=Conexibacter arvalis TaxID=912552 RepID=A0A840I8G7_9ACTN|nr:ABC transporter ATP-binding protein [Conexibacter arvalis]MBB4660543.1 oligopeptide/dipeptide ABC transporter ATP-binding protein [Conexibacter arvalis]